MAYDVSPVSKRWNEIVNMQDENSQNRAIRRYVYDLETKVSSQESELNRLKIENEQYKKDILSINVVKEAIRKAKSEVYDKCNTDWGGLQGGF